MTMQTVILASLISWNQGLFVLLIRHRLILFHRGKTKSLNAVAHYLQFLTLQPIHASALQKNG
jgi:uncharacterized membrane protein YdcZ (DUF606 family)